MKLTSQISKNNYLSFLWHANFLALAQNFMDIDTIIPAMMVDAGGTSLHIGLLTAIMIGGGKLSQLFFAPFLSNNPRKKKFLLIGINARVLALAGMSLLFIFSASLAGNLVILIILTLIFVFAISGGFANINYTDILGKSILKSRRKHFFSIKQIITSLGVLVSAYFARSILRHHPYPDNYSLLFLIAAGLLAVASLGFWKIKEALADNLTIKHFKDFFQVTIQEFKENKRLIHYLFILNTQGTILVLMPFLILYAKQRLGADSYAIGNYLLIKVIGGVLVGSILFYYARKIRYHFMLYVTSIMAILSIIALLIFTGELLFPYIFLAGGIIYALHRIVISGVLLEVTNSKNRALYTGLSGAGNILPSSLPLIGGFLVKQYGFPTLFLIIIFFILSSFYFIYKLNCQH